MGGEKKETEMAGDPPLAPEVGWTDGEVARLRDEHGFNEVITKSESLWWSILKRYLGVVPIIILTAAILSVAIEDDDGRRDWVSFGLLLFELNLIVFVDWYGERNAGRAVAELQKLAAPNCHVKRNGRWETIPVRELVPGDLVQLNIGDVTPGDCRLVSHSDAIQLDEAALTGEALPVTKYAGDEVLGGAVVSQGDTEAHIIRTGANTFFGKSIALVSSASNNEGNLQKILKRVARTLAGIGAVFCIVLFFILILSNRFKSDFSFGEALKLAAVLLVATVPVALPVVTSVTLAVGSRELTREKAIVTRMSAIESLAGMEILCSDKTGTLTLNHLTMHDPWIPAGVNINFERMVELAALSAKKEDAGRDAIDQAVVEAVPDINKLRSENEVLKFVPFDPVSKKTTARIREVKSGRVFEVTKGAPTVVRDLVEPTPSLRADIDEQILEFASRGLRALGLAIRAEDETQWQFLGLFSIFDPPRHDTQETIERALELGVDVKMITGDQQAIAVETCRQLGMNAVTILSSDTVDVMSREDLARVAKDCSGFAGVYPEHKFKIVEAIQHSGIICGMTGDGVNDAPALKQADIGIAVHGSTEAAKGAADIILTEPGLSVIIVAILRARKIFQRLKGYITYRLASSMLILLFFFLTIVSLEIFIPLWILVILSLLNDFSVMATSTDHVHGSAQPERWNMKKIMTVSFVIGGIGVISSFLFVYLASPDYEDWWGEFDIGTLTEAELVAVVFLQVALSIQFNIFSTRTESFFWSRKPSVPVAVAVAVSMIVSTFLAVYWPDDVKLGGGANMDGAGWEPCLIVWAYNIFWFIICDLFKVLVYLSWEEEDGTRRISQLFDRLRASKHETKDADLRKIMKSREVDRQQAGTLRRRDTVTTVDGASLDVARVIDDNRELRSTVQQLQAQINELKAFQEHVVRFVGRGLGKSEFLELYPEQY